MNIYQQAINKFGSDHQILKAVEELNELATALMHYRDSKAPEYIVVSEVADVQIMLEQLKLIFDPELINEAMASKFKKLNKTIN